MIFASHRRAAAFLADDPRPRLAVVVDAEEDFDWARFPYVPKGVASVAHQERAQRLFDRRGIVPTYAVDYPVATEPDGYEVLAEFLRDQRCMIAAQLHPWVNPPIEEEMSLRNTFPGNLPKALEYEKIRLLTDAIERNLGVRPRAYRAGRFGAGRHTAEILAALGYEVDMSVLPFFDLRVEGGPDYRHVGSEPFWCGPSGEILEIASTVAMMGLLAPLGPHLYGFLDRPLMHRLKMPAIFARLGLLDRIRLTPEGILVEEAIHLTRGLFARGQRLFVLSYHSPSLEPGNTPYVRTRADLDTFLDWIEKYLDFFLGAFDGVPTTIAQEAEDAHRKRELGAARELAHIS